MLNADTAGSGGGQRYMPDAAGEWLCEVLQSIAILHYESTATAQDKTVPAFFVVQGVSHFFLHVSIERAFGAEMDETIAPLRTC